MRWAQYLVLALALFDICYAINLLPASASKSWNGELSVARIVKVVDGSLSELVHVWEKRSVQYSSDSNMQLTGCFRIRHHAQRRELRENELGGTSYSDLARRSRGFWTDTGRNESCRCFISLPIS
ncbi:hypothetical protein R3P38DRAFT_3352574 [Favolaschia claudopus]|uniref:Uncharacterized protein n=1 Tax=Favolaschia claudopus TaxID=2862362 RepID=A0AAW0C255_9AGAR